MNHPVLTLTRNCLDLTKRCLQTVCDQDVRVWPLVVDNGSTDGTKQFLDTMARETTLRRWNLQENIGVSAAWNIGLRAVLDGLHYEHCLVINNDVELPSWLYSELLSYDVPFVTGVAVDRRPTEKPERMPLTPNPDFSCFLIRREAWEKIGPFDETMKLYASDCDYHVRGHRLGLAMMKANVPYFHINSQTLKQANPEERAAIYAQADADRQVFQKRYGCLPGTKEYEALFS